MSRRRDLSEDEAALWSGAVRSVKPLRAGKTAPKAAGPRPETQKTPPMSRAPLPAPSPAQPLPLMPFDRRLRQRVARGRDAIDARIDLHGKTQSEAYAALLHFLHRAQADGATIALVVTGKGARGGLTERGVLKRQVPQWLALPEFRPFVVGFEDAHPSHGGQGALYVRVRRAR